MSTYVPYNPDCTVNGTDCCGHHARSNAPVTPSQVERIKAMANDLYWRGLVTGERDAIESAEAHVLDIFDADPRDIDARCQPMKSNPERYDSEGNWRA